MEGSFFSLLPTRGIVLKKRFEVFGQSWRAIRITQFVNDHRCLECLVQERLGNPGVAVDPRRINRSNATPCRCRDPEPAVLPTGRKQLHGVPYRKIKNCSEPGAHDHRVRSVAKIVETSVLDLFRQVGRLKMKSGFDTVKINGRVFKACASAERATQNGCTGNNL